MSLETMETEPVDFTKLVGEDDFSCPDQSTKVFKDHCTYCFRTPYFEGGLFVCLKTYCAFCRHCVSSYAERTGSVAFVQVLSKKVAVRDDEPEQKISRLAVGVEGGFCNEKFDIVDDYFFTTYPNFDKRAQINVELGEKLYEACNKVVTTTSAERLELLQNASNAWDGELKQVTKHANLEQLNNGKVVPLSGWKCEHENCDLTENLWLNLTDGAVRCGRSQFISEGVKSKGNNHMKQYFDSTGHPLVLKLGTVEKDASTADVYSYDEDEAVIDPNLHKHLAHFGLDIDKMEKTEKSTLELEMDMNQKWEWSRLQEDGANLENAYGPGYTGLINIGSSCYMNSVLQSLLLIPEFRDRYSGESAQRLFSSIPPVDVFRDFNAQTTRLVTGMLSGDYAVPDGDHNGIKPTQFKRVTGAGHVEFSTAKQQDVEEYFRYLTEKLSNSVTDGEVDPTVAYKFKTEVRFCDKASGHVRYSVREDVILSLPVVEPDFKFPASGEKIAVSFDTCLQYAFREMEIDGYKSPVTGETKGATSTIRFSTFPDFLFVQLQKFVFDTATASAKKVDCEISIDDEIDLSPLRGCGIQEGELPLPEDASVTVAPALPPVDEGVVAQLEAMGFTHNACVKALIETKNSGVESAMEWIMVHMDDPTLNDPPVAPSAAPAAAPASAPVNAGDVDMLVGFGFTAQQARYSLRRNGGDVNASAEWLFGHADEVPAEEPEVAAQPAPRQEGTRRDVEYRDGSGKYKLVGLLSHMGSSPHSGHYVAHLLKDGKWILFNDEKVAVSQNPPKQYAYIYVFQRI